MLRKFVTPTLLAVVLTTAQAAKAQNIDINGTASTIQETDMPLQQAQDQMDPLRLIEAYLVDKDGPRNERGGWGTRRDNVYETGEQIDAVIYLANVGKHHPGQVDNAQEMELYINIRDEAGDLIHEIRPVHTFRDGRRIDTPLQEDYFQDRFTVSARLTQPGSYRVGFVFIDRTRPADKQTTLEVPLDVVVAKSETWEDATSEGISYQANMPPMTLSRSMFLDMDASNTAGVPVDRESNVFANGERIAIYAKFANAGRMNPGAVNGQMSITTDIRVIDGSGSAIIDQRVPTPTLEEVSYPYDGPVPDGYFDSFKLTLFVLPAPGDYEIVLTFTDQTRPPEETQPVELVLNARVAQ